MKRSGLLKRKTRLKHRSPRKSKQWEEYLKLRAQFLKDHPYCEWWLAENGFKMEDVIEVIGRGPVVGRRLEDGFRCVEYRVPRSQDIHHKKHRGKYLLDTSTWTAVSREGHRWIHDHPAEAYSKGYLLPRNQ